MRKIEEREVSETFPKPIETFEAGLRNSSPENLYDIFRDFSLGNLKLDIWDFSTKIWRLTPLKKLGYSLGSLYRLAPYIFI